MSYLFSGRGGGVSESPVFFLLETFHSKVKFQKRAGPQQNADKKQILIVCKTKDPYCEQRAWRILHLQC